MLIVLQNVKGHKIYFFHKVIKSKGIILQTLILWYVPGRERQVLKILLVYIVLKYLLRCLSLYSSDSSIKLMSIEDVIIISVLSTPNLFFLSYAPTLQGQNWIIPLSSLTSNPTKQEYIKDKGVFLYFI